VSATLEVGGAAVTLDAATATVVDLRFEAPPEEVAAFGLVSSAIAHPGHDFSGATEGELLGSYDLDLLGSPSVLGEASMLPGAYATARFTLASARLAGTWGDRSFDLAITPDREITGVPFVATAADGDAPEIGLSADFAHALGFVDLATPDSDGDDVLTVADAPAGNSATFGLTSSTTWILTESP
jgi:hypothetical protein